MGARRPLTEQYGSFVCLLIFLAALASTIVASCGGGGGDDSTGALCDQCGATDGLCQDVAFIFPANGMVVDAEPCPTASGNPNGCLEVPLLCRRKVDSAQQRCYPRGEVTDVPLTEYRCDGSRPAEHTVAPQPTRTLTPTPDVTPGCGNGVKDGNEECDGADLDGNTCTDFCVTGAGTLRCSATCQFDTSGCLGGPCNQ